jgi:mercuric reductase
MALLPFRRKKDSDFDLIVLGGGSAAFAAAIRAAEMGASVAIAEEGAIGGTCVNRGCLPTKNLLYAAERYHLYSHNSFPGLPVGKEVARFREIINQKDALVEEMRQHKYWDILKAYPTIKYYPHKARFLSPHEVQIGEEILRAEKFIIATGASPSPLPIPGLHDIPLLTYKEALELSELPTSLLVIGGGPIGLELGQMFFRFGSQVTILEMMPHIAPLEEEEISQTLEQALSEEGMKIHTSVRVLRAQKENGSCRLIAEVGGRPKEFTAQRVLLAAGLKPNTADLNLEAARVKTDPKGAVVVDEELRTTARHIYAAGDVIGKMMLVTVAAHQGGIAAENALRGKKEKMDYAAVPHAIFTSPQVASVGLKEREAREKGFKVETTTLPFELVPKAGAIRDTRGVFKMVVDSSTYRILGVHIVALDAADLIHLGTLAIRHKLTVGDLIRMVFVYPTMTEAYKIAALSFKKDVTKLSCCAA